MSNGVVASLALSLVPLLSLASAAQAAGSQTDFSALTQMSPAQRGKIMSKRAAQAAKAQPRSTLAPGDWEWDPPVLKAFKAGTKVNATAPGAQLSFSLAITDKGAGVAAYNVYATGPSGQVISSSTGAGFPVNKFTGNGAIDFTNYVQSGAWQVTHVDVFDTFGNASSYSAEQLAQFGNTQFTVTSSGYDSTPPSLVLGKVLTPKVSYSTADKWREHWGTYVPLIGAEVSATDASDQFLSGVKSALLTFCSLINREVYCVQMSGVTTKHGQSSLKLSLLGDTYISWNDGNNFEGPAPSGNYTLESVTIYDFAGNSSYLVSDRWGGAVDLTPYFDTTKLVIAP